MMPRTWEVAVSRSRDALSSREVAVCCPRDSLSLRAVAACRSSASLSLRVSSAIFFSSLVWGACAVAVRRGGFLALRRFVLGRLGRAALTQSSRLGAREMLAYVWHLHLVYAPWVGSPCSLGQSRHSPLNLTGDSSV